ncbi:L,D-transpeptidase family protein [Streptomyces sp. NPDC007808]|uniref:L,D-transpeptidase family protein n=1 Tax=Streptomyces sp. NPDC007808 TaxID=3364779 RepID=UPI00368C507B
MRNRGTRRVTVTTAARATALTVLVILSASAALTTMTACDASGPRGGAGPGGGANAGSAARTSPSATADPTRVPGLSDRWQRRIPEESRQVVAVYGDGVDSPRSTVVLYTRHGTTWERVRAWPAHNGKKGWTTDHREGDNRSPVGVFTLSDAGGVLRDPGSRLPYTRSTAFAAPRWWSKSHWHDFDHVIAIDYNRVRGTPPNDPTRPEGRAKGGGIWLHLDHGSGTSACVSLSESAMEYLLRTLDPERRPVMVMGDRAELAR